MIAWDLAVGRDVQAWVVRCQRCQSVIIEWQGDPPQQDAELSQAAEAICEVHAATCPGEPVLVIRGRITED